MISRRGAAIAVTLLLLVAAMYFLRVRDNTAVVRVTDLTIAEGFSSLGLSDSDIVSRKITYWRDARERGAFLEYNINDNFRHDVAEMQDRLETWLRRLRGVRISEVSYEKTGPSGGRAVFEVVSGGHVVLRLNVSDIRPGWTGSAVEPAAPPKPRKMAGKDQPDVPSAASVKKKPFKDFVKRESPMLAVVLDDFGYSRENFGALKKLDIPVTMAVLPNAPYTAMACDFAGKNNMEVILHLPMEPMSGKDFLEKDTIMTDMTPDRMTDIISADLLSVYGASGISNHMGSKATGDARTMRVVLREAGKRGLYFLDSMTTADSVGKSAALDAGVPCAARDIFLDNKNDEEYISGQMEKAAEIAVRKGKAVAIGHDRKNTVQVMAEMVPRLEKRGIKFVALSEIVSEKE